MQIGKNFMDLHVFSGPEYNKPLRINAFLLLISDSKWISPVLVFSLLLRGKINLINNRLCSAFSILNILGKIIQF